MERQPIVIVEGPAVCGRTDVARGIANKYNLILKQGCQTPAEFVQAMQPALDRERGVVIDGGWHMTYVAAMARGKKPPISAVHRRMLTRLALSRGGVVVKALTSLRSFLINTSYKTPLNGDNLNLLFDAYEEWEELDPWLPFHTCNLHTSTVFETLWPQLERDWRISNVGPGIGSFTHHKVVLVGDRHGRSLQPYNIRLNVPFVSMSGVGCSEWLTQELMYAHIKECDLYWINAYDKEGKPTDDDFMVDKTTPFIALGGAAANWCDIVGVPYDRVPHPQFWKRFHYDEEYPLIPLLKRYIREAA